MFAWWKEWQWINLPLMMKPRRTVPTPSHSTSIHKIWDFVMSRVSLDGPVPSMGSMFQAERRTRVSTKEPVEELRSTKARSLLASSRYMPLLAP